jgi:signal peptidase I
VLNVLLVVTVSVATYLVVPLVAQLVRVRGDSMAPSLQDEQLLFVNKLAYRFEPLRHGDVIVFRSLDDSNTELIKRVVGLPGEDVSIQQGKVMLNGEYLEEPYVIEPGTTKYGPMTVKEGTVFVLGDHRIVSNDSRAWGLLPIGNVIGRAEFSVWPLRAIS